MIVSWTLMDDGQPVPVTPEAIDNLKGSVASYIYREIGRLNPDLAELEDEQPPSCSSAEDSNKQRVFVEPADTDRPPVA